MKTSNLSLHETVLAYDRRACCMRAMSGADCEFVDGNGDVVEGYEWADTDKGLVCFKEPSGRLVVRPVDLRIVLCRRAENYVNGLGR